MGATFKDISLYLPTPYDRSSDEFKENVALEKFICDLYVQCLQGYKPPKATRLTIQPAFYGVWKRAQASGSVISTSAPFTASEYYAHSKAAKKVYLLELIQEAVLRTGSELGWEAAPFENAYSEVRSRDFVFSFDFPKRLSRSGATAFLRLEKSETVTSLSVVVSRTDSNQQINLFTKPNGWSLDDVYPLVKTGKWFDECRFGFFHKSSALKGWVNTFDFSTGFTKGDRELTPGQVVDLFDF